MTRNSVVLPHPEGPRSETKLCSSMVNDTRSSTWTASPRSLANQWLMLRHSMRPPPSTEASASVEAEPDIDARG